MPGWTRPGYGTALGGLSFLEQVRFLRIQQWKLQRQHPTPMHCTLAHTIHFQLSSGNVTYSTIRVLPGGDGIIHLAHSLGRSAALRQTVQIERLAISRVNCMCSLMSLPSHFIRKDWLGQSRIPAVPLAPTLLHPHQTTPRICSCVCCPHHPLFSSPTPTWGTASTLPPNCVAQNPPFAWGITRIEGHVISARGIETGGERKAHSAGRKRARFEATVAAHTSFLVRIGAWKKDAGRVDVARCETRCRSCTGRRLAGEKEQRIASRWDCKRRFVGWPMLQ